MMSFFLSCMFLILTSSQNKKVFLENRLCNESNGNHFIEIQTELKLHYVNFLKLNGVVWFKTNGFLFNFNMD